jgi:hypothetical protein
VSLLSTSSVMVFPVSVFTKICIFAGGRALASIPSLDRSALRPAYPAGGLLCDGVGDELVRCDPMLATRTCVVSFIDGSEVAPVMGTLGETTAKSTGHDASNPRDACARRFGLPLALSVSTFSALAYVRTCRGRIRGQYCNVNVRLTERAQ